MSRFVLFDIFVFFKKLCVLVVWFFELGPFLSYVTKASVLRNGREGISMGRLLYAIRLNVTKPLGLRHCAIISNGDVFFRLDVVVEF